MKSEHRAARHADALLRHRHQHQRAGRQAWPVDHDPLAGFTPRDRTGRGTDRPVRRDWRGCVSRPVAASSPRIRGCDNDYPDGRHSHLRFPYRFGLPLRSSYADICGKVSSAVRAGDAGFVLRSSEMTQWARRRPCTMAPPRSLGRRGWKQPESIAVTPALRRRTAEPRAGTESCKDRMRTLHTLCPKLQLCK